MTTSSFVENQQIMKPALFSLFTIFILFSCQQSNTDTYQIKLKGSESMHAVFMDLKKDFEKKHKNIELTLEGGGSRTGLEAIKNHQADIGLSSFEFDLTKELGNNHSVKEKVIGYDGIVLIANENNPLDSLTDDQIHSIYQGSIFDWSQLGGNSGSIVPIIRDENSGTQRFFIDHFNIVSMTRSAVVSAENKEILSKVQGDINAIGFIGFAYFTQGVHDLRLATEDSNGYRSPTKRNLLNNSYPLKRGLRIYYEATQSSAVNTFIKYLDSKEAKAIIESYGLIAMN